MKKSFFYIATAAIALVSCNEENLVNVTVHQGNKVLTASFEQDPSATRMNIAAEGNALTWSEGDEIAVISEGGEQNCYVLSSGAGTAKGVFALELEEGGTEIVGVKAAFPYADVSVTDGIIAFNLSSSLEPGTTGDCNLPMLGAIENGAIAFKHLAGVLKVNLTDIPIGYNTLTVTASNPISGQFTVTTTEDVSVLESESTNESDKTVTVTFTEAAEDANDEVLYLPLPVGEYASIVVSVSDGTDAITLKNWTNKTVVRAKVYSTSANCETYVTSAEDLVNAISNATEGATINLGADITMTEILTIDENITFDGNGHTLTSSGGRAINVDENATNVTIKNLTIESTGERAINIINSSKTVVVDNVKAVTKNYAVNVATSASNVNLTIKNCDLTGLNVVNLAGAGTKVVISNTKLSCVDNNTAEGYGAICIYNTGEGIEVSMEGGSISISGTSCDDSDAGHISADAASITLNNVQGENLEITMGSYFIAYANQTAYSFETLTTALEYAKGGETICLSRNVALSDTYTIDKDITINLNGYDLDASENTSRPFNVKNGKLTIKGGESEIKVGKYGLVNIPAESENATVVLEGGVYEGNTDNGSFLKPRGEGKVSFTMTNVTYTDSSTDGYVMDASSYEGDDANISMQISGCELAAAGGLISVVGNVSITDTEITTSGDDYKFASIEFSGKGSGSIENSTITSTSDAGIAVSVGYGATMTVENCKVTGKKFAYCVYQSGGTINVTTGENGSYEGPVEVYGDLYDDAASDAKITIDGQVNVDVKR